MLGGLIRDCIIGQVICLRRFLQVLNVLEVTFLALVKS